METMTTGDWEWCTMISISIYLQDFTGFWTQIWGKLKRWQSFVANVASVIVRSVVGWCPVLWFFKAWCCQGVVGPWRRTCEARWSAAFQPAVEGTASTMTNHDPPWGFQEWHRCSRILPQIESFLWNSKTKWIKMVAAGSICPLNLKSFCMFLPTVYAHCRLDLFADGRWLSWAPAWVVVRLHFGCATRSRNPWDDLVDGAAVRPTVFQ